MAAMEGEKEQKRQASTWKLVSAHAALIAAQVSFGVAAVVAAVGLHNSVAPLVFALIRDCTAGPLLCILGVRVAALAPILAPIIRPRSHLRRRLRWIASSSGASTSSCCCCPVWPSS